MNIQDQKFGIEIELTGITREQAAKTIAEYFQCAYHALNNKNFFISINRKKTWKVVSDSSIIPQVSEKSSEENRLNKYQTEIVSPICTYQDIPVIQDIVQKLKEAGAVVGGRCGIHIHVDASPHTPKSLWNIANIVSSKEDLLYKALQVSPERMSYCRKANQAFLDQLNSVKPKNMEQVKAAWYGDEQRSPRHYDESRYHFLNLHAVFDKGTVEFRGFNSTLNPGKVKAYIQLCLAVSAQAMRQKRAMRKNTESDNEKYTFRVWLLRLGLIGDEFKTTRYYLLENLEGNIAWKNPAQAELQKERRKQKALQHNQEEPSGQEPVEEERAAPFQPTLM